MSTLVIHHANCIDGFTAAVIAKDVMPEAELFPAAYGDDPPDVAGRDVLIFDFSYPREMLIRMQAKAESLLVFDHHKTAAENCEGLDFCTFDMERSGAMMAWDHFHPDKSSPLWIEAVQDRDLWRWQLVTTEAVHAFLSSLPFDFDVWQAIEHMSLPEIMSRGEAILKYTKSVMKKKAPLGRLVTIEGKQVIAINATYDGLSELLHYLLETFETADYAMGYGQQADGSWRYSVRSRPGFDVSKVAKQYGGGGHAQAAGFEADTLFMALLEAQTQ